MFGGLVPFLVLLAVPVTLAVVLVTVPRRRALVAVDEVEFPGLARLRRSAILARLLALGAGPALAVPLASMGSLGRGLMLVPPAFAAVQIVGVLLGDVVARSAARTTGVAGLDVRRVRDFLPRQLTRYVVLTGIALTALLVWASAIAGPDDLGRAGRALRYGCTDDCTAGSISGSFSPWPGSFYAAPLAVGLLVVALLAAAALVITVRRPRNGSDLEIRRVDDVIRRRSVESIVAGAGIAVAGSLAGLGLFAGPALATRENLSSGLQSTGLLITVAALTSVVLTVWCVVVLLLPGAGRGRPGRDVAGDGSGRAARVPPAAAWHPGGDR